MVKRGLDNDPQCDFLLEDIERALFARIEDDAIDQCEVLSAEGDLIDKTSDGTGLTYVIYTVSVSWNNDNTEQDR